MRYLLHVHSPEGKHAQMLLSRRTPEDTAQAEKYIKENRHSERLLLSPSGKKKDKTSKLGPAAKPKDEDEGDMF